MKHHVLKNINNCIYKLETIDSVGNENVAHIEELKNNIYSLKQDVLEDIFDENYIKIVMDYLLKLEKNIELYISTYDNL